jgi:hypothetical protein
MDAIQNMDNEFTLPDFFNVLKEGKIWIFSVASLCAIAGATYASLKPVKYEAKATIQMATVAGSAVETPSILVEKLKLPLYYASSTVKACGLEGSPTAGQELAAALKPAINKNAPFVTISYKGNAAEGAAKCLQSVLEDIQVNQGLLSKPIVDAKKSQLSLLQQKLMAAEKLTGLLPTKNLKFNFSDSQFSAASLLILTLTTKENEIKDLRNQINDLQIALQEPQTRGPKLVTEIYAPNVSTESNRGLIALLAAFIGGFLALIVLVYRRIAKPAK